MIVKICGITRREDAEAAVEAGASALGFIFFKPSPRYVTPAKARELADGLNVLKVGVFVDESSELVNAARLEARLDIAQVYGAFSASIARLWRAVRVANTPPGGCAFLADSAEAVLLDSSANGVSFDWQIARPLCERRQVVIAGGLDAANVAQAIRIARPWGVDASSRLESSPGIKDHGKVREFIQAAQEIS